MQQPQCKICKEIVSYYFYYTEDNDIFCPDCYVAFITKLYKYRLGKDFFLKLSNIERNNPLAEDFKALAHKCNEKAHDIDPRGLLEAAKYTTQLDYNRFLAKQKSQHSELKNIWKAEAEEDRKLRQQTTKTTSQKYKTVQDAENLKKLIEKKFNIKK